MSKCVAISMESRPTCLPPQTDDADTISPQVTSVTSVMLGVCEVPTPNVPCLGNRRALII